MVKQGKPGDEWYVGQISPDVSRAPVQRIAIITEAYLPKVDGVSKLASLTASHHINEGRDVIIFAPNLTLEHDGKRYHTSEFPPHPTDGDYRSEAIVASVPSWRVSFFPKETRVGSHWLLRFRKQLADFRPDLVHLFSPAAFSLMGRRYARRHGVPLIANYQTDLPGYTHRYNLGFLKGYVWQYIRWLHNGATLNLIPTHMNIRDLKDREFENLRLWSRGVDKRRFNPDKRSLEMRQRMLNGQPDDNLIVLYVGRLANEKRVDLLEEVIDLDGVRVVIVGDGSTRAELQDQFGDRVTFMGFLKGEDLAQAYASADLFGFTGTNEVAGQVVKEAMASGLPVLVPNAGGIVDYVLDGINGYICQTEARDYREKVMRVRDNPEHRQQMALQALTYARQRSWEDTMAELERLYTEAYELHRARQRHQSSSASG